MYWRSVLVALAIATAQPLIPEGQVPAQPGVVTGILRASTGLPLEAVRIAVTPVGQSLAFPALERLGLTVQTDNAGRYRVENISPGSYHIMIGVGLRFYYPGVGDKDAARVIQVAAGATMEVPDTVVPGGTVAGRLVDMTIDKGRRIENLVLCCDYSKQVYYSEAGRKEGSPFTPTISDDGSFVFPFVPAGNYVLSILDRNVIPVSWALAVGTNGVTGLQLNLTEGVEVQGTALDQTGKPVSASVRLIPRPANSVFNTIGPPTYTGAGPKFFEYGSTQGLSLVLRGTLIPKAAPSLDDLRDLLLKTASMQDRSATPGPDGGFAFQNVYPGTYVLEVKSGGIVLPEREIQVGPAGLKNIAFQVSAIQVTGLVIAPNSGPLPKLNYIRLVRSGSDDVVYGFPDKEGQFSLALLPGRYQVFTEHLGPSVKSVSDGTRDITNTEVTFEGGRNPQILVTLEP